jgi:uncharacterized ubiquitin-like protein YukD
VLNDIFISDHKPIEITINLNNKNKPTIRKNQIKIQNKKIIFEREKTIRNIFTDENFSAKKALEEI